ncbi:MAG: hypothetical protein RLY77_903 [Pseudomonadota bacterium]|jgi:PAS domain S-box-containing protein
MSSKIPASGLSLQHLDQLINALADGVIVLDKNACIVAANSAALDMHACITRVELGADAAEYGQRFGFREPTGRVVASKRTPMARVLLGEHFRGWELEVSRSGDASFSRILEFDELVLNDQFGGREYALLIVRNHAEKVDAEYLFARFFSAKPQPAAILRLEDSRYLRVNDGFCELTGFGSEELVGRPLHEIDVFREADQRDAALQALASHEIIRPQESRVFAKDGGSRSVMISGQPIVVAGRPCMLLSFVDLEFKRRAEDALRQSEERFAKAFRMAPVPMLVCVQSNWCVIEANGALGTAVGRSRGEIVGYPFTRIGLHLSNKALRDIGIALESGQGVLNRDVQLRTPDGSIIEGALSAESVVIHDEACALFVIQDVTDRKRTEAELISAIEAVMKDASWFSRTVMEKLAHVRRPQAAAANSESLTTREREVLELICSARNDGDIADTLGLSRNTVRNHVATLYGKIGVNRRSAAVVWGRERGFGAS